MSPLANKAESKAKTTDSVFRSIVNAETNSREAKTERLRLLRLSREAEAAPPAEPVRKAAKKTGARAKG